MNEILCGDALTTLRTLSDASVQCCVTSPPYYCLRDYGIDGQIGNEETPFAYVEKLVAVFAEVRRVLRDDGTLWLNLGDSYANNRKWGGHSSGKHQKALHDVTRPMRWTGLPGKNLIGIPWRVAFALQDNGWILRSEIIWEKPNVLCESVEDRPTKSHEQIFLFSKQARYYYDGGAIKEPSMYPDDNRKARVKVGHKSQPTALTQGIRAGSMTYPTRNKRSVWRVNTRSYAEAHFATFPPKLIEPCILAGSRPGDIILDPFMGAGTTALVALQHKRRYLGIELNPAYVALAEKRIAHVQQGLWIDKSEVSA